MELAVSLRFSLILKHLFQSKIIFKSGIFSILDQCFFAGANLILNIILARWLEPKIYGTFALIYSLFILLSALHTALIIEPMVIYGSGKYSNQFNKYFATVSFVHLIVSIFASIFLIIISFIIAQETTWSISGPLNSLSFSILPILSMQYIRRAFYVQLRPVWAALISFCYFCFVIGGVNILRYFDLISPSNVFLILGLCSTLICGFFLGKIDPDWKAIKNIFIIDVIIKHWTYGRWALGNAMLVWLSGHIYFVVLSIWIGLESVGDLRALLNLTIPAQHVIYALSFLMMPLCVKAYNEYGIKRITQYLKMFLALFVGGSTCYFIILYIFRDNLFPWIYASKYVHLSSYIPIVGLLPILMGIIAVFDIGLRCLERTDVLFWCQGLRGFIALIVIGPLCALWGIKSVVWGMLFLSFFSSFITYLAYSWITMKGSKQ